MSHRKRFWLTLLLIILISILFGVVIWTRWTHDLHLNVYSDDEFWYREEFPPYVKVIVTVCLSFVFGLFAAVVTWLVRSLLLLHGQRER